MNVSTHNGQYFSPGDTIVLCDEGGVFRSTLAPPSGGIAGSRITYSGGGTATFSASNIVSGWSLEGGRVYRASISTGPEQVFINGQFGNRKDSFGELKGDLDWFWASGKLYLYSDAGDPDNAYSDPGVEAGARYAAVDIYNRSFLTIDGIVARHAQDSGVVVSGGTSDLVIRNSVFEWNYLKGFYKSSPNPHHNGVIEDNVARRNGGAGIVVNVNHNNTVIRRNLVYENGSHQGNRHEQQYYTGGIKVWGKWDFVSNMVIEENVVYDNGPIFDAPGGSGVGIWVDACAGNEGPNLVRRNKVYGNFGNGIYIEISSNAEVSYNVLRDNAHGLYTAGISVKAWGSHVVGDNFVHNNTIYGSGYWGIYCGVYDNGGVPKESNNTFTNNVAVGSGEANLHAQNACVNDGFHGTGNTFRFNAFGAEAPGFILWDWMPLSTYADLDSSHGQLTYSVAGDPRLTDPENGDLSISADSPLHDSGYALGFGQDLGLRRSSAWPTSVETIDQDSQGNGWEIGAYVIDESDSSPSDLIFEDEFSDGLDNWSVVMN